MVNPTAKAPVEEGSEAVLRRPEDGQGDGCHSFRAQEGSESTARPSKLWEPEPARLHLLGP